VQPPGPPAPGKPPAQETAVLDWLPIGPVGRGDPVWYAGLKDRNCGAVPDSDDPPVTVERVARKLCLGLKGQKAAWEEGASALDTMPPPKLPNSDCWSVKAYEVLRDVAAFRRQKPDVPFKLAPLPGTACPPELKDLSVVGRPSDSVCPGDIILLGGTLGGLPANSISEVNVGTTTAKVGHRASPPGDSYPLGDFYFKAPTPVQGAPATVDVTVAKAKLSVKGTTSFAYAVDQNTCLQAAPGNIP
jgi:hypothetical protein